MSLDFVIQLTSGGGRGLTSRPTLDGPHLRYSPAERSGVRNSEPASSQAHAVRAWSGRFSAGAGLMRIVRRPSKRLRVAGGLGEVTVRHPRRRI